MTLAELSSQHPLFEAVLDRYQLRYADSGLPVGVACENAEIEADFFVEILHLFEAPQDFDAERLMQFPVPVILDYLYRTHAYYQEKRLGEIELSVERLSTVYGGEHALLVLLRTFFTRYKNQLTAHIKEEEAILFPFAAKAYALNHKGEGIEEKFDFTHFLHAHGEDELDAPLREIQQLVERRHPEVKSLFPYNVLNWQLNALQQDLWIHERVEEEVLIPLIQKIAEDNM